MKKFIITDLAKGNANISVDQVLEIGGKIGENYSSTETKTGGTWIDDKDIYTITQLTVDTPPTMDTAFPTEVIGSYTVYKYTKP